jgi:preprotein translocase subunit SecA
MVLKAASGRLQRLTRIHAAGLSKILPLVEKHTVEFAGIDDEAIKAEAMRLGLELRRHGFMDEVVATVFALIREASARTIGKRHFDVQIMGGWALLKGMVAEMETGEGKTLTATLAAGTAALAGVPVHVLTVNDYLTHRDAEEMGPVYRALGLSVGCVIHDVPVTQRRHEYLCDVTYCTNKEIVFDYLRDKLVLKEMSGTTLRLRVESLYAKEPRHNRLLLRGLYYAITDEADSLLIDESRTPLIISGSVIGKEEVSFMRIVFDFAKTLVSGKDFSIDESSRQVKMTASGTKKIRGLVLPADTRWTGTIRKNEMILRAVSALHLFSRDKDYLVRDGKVQIIDVFTGRVMPDRSWEQGLQQLIEIKEGCEVTEQQETVAKISFQRFFRRYLHLAGMTGTAREVTGELWSVYGLSVVRIHTYRPLRRTALPDTVFACRDERDRYLLGRVRDLHATGRPLLIGTGSVAASEEISRLLMSAGLRHKVLNAKNDAEEAEIVALAGERSSITIATNMAGRGTDIKLPAGVDDLGGLHVILTELHEAARIDRQFVGRCARQGDPGSHESILALDDVIREGVKGSHVGMLVKRLVPKSSKFWNLAAKYAIVHVQKETERHHGRLRRSLLKQDLQMKSLMSFSRREE